MSNKYNIGDIWICPRCDCRVIISNAGIDHKCKNSWIKYSPDDLRVIREYSERQEKFWFYGQQD